MLFIVCLSHRVSRQITHTMSGKSVSLLSIGARSDEDTQDDENPNRKLKNSK